MDLHDWGCKWYKQKITHSLSNPIIIRFFRIWYVGIRNAIGQKLVAMNEFQCWMVFFLFHFALFTCANLTFANGLFKSSFTSWKEIFVAIQEFSLVAITTTAAINCVYQQKYCGTGFGIRFMLLLSQLKVRSAEKQPTNNDAEKRERDDTIPFFKLRMSQRFTIVDEGENDKKR